MIVSDRKERWTSLAGVVLLHVLLGWALLLGLAPSLVRGDREPLRAFEISEPVPPPPDQPVPEPPAAPAPRETAGAASPPAPKAEPSSAAPAKAPEWEVPPPVAAGLVPASGGQVSPIGPGSGGGAGAGSGSGSAGSGSGGGGGGGSGAAVTRAALRTGRIVPADYPPAAGGTQGTVETRLNVSAMGAVTGCRVTRSSGNEVLDTTTCRLIRERFRFAPARDAQGNPVPDVQGWRQRWWRD